MLVAKKAEVARARVVDSRGAGLCLGWREGVGEDEDVRAGESTGGSASPTWEEGRGIVFDDS